MKKTVAITLIILTMLLALTACGDTNPEDTTPPGQQQPATDEPEPSTEGEPMQSYMGKVSDITGNELTVELGTFAGDLGAEGLEGEAMEPGSFSVAPSQSGEAGIVYEVEDSAGVGEGDMVQSITAIGGADGGVSFFVNGEDGELDLEYSGETKSFTVPAGAKITSFTGEGKLENIKKGSIVSVMVDSSGTVTDIIIMQ